ncbi:MAG TPA: hypothetical protein VKB93_21360 [Thermoanaerobaculia bacterium]|nr:hypothetical protein [Thermoanaerobaculia bacterium]
MKTYLVFLFEDYGFEEAEAELLMPGMWIYLRNATSQVAVRFEYDGALWMTIGRLELFDGRIVGGEEYNVDYLLRLRAPELEQNEIVTKFDERKIAELLNNWGIALRLHADDILRGDFSIFSKLAKVQSDAMARRLGTSAD